MVAEIRLESLLDPNWSPDGDTIPEYNEGDLTLASFECADALQEVYQLESNLAAYEAAKIVKKAKSKKKVVKAKTSKMKAGDAKKKKKANKKVRVSKEDEEVDGGTGPLPTTADTDGLTDTDLDAVPDEQVVNVTEPSDEPSEEIGTEGVDYFVEYEDASIMTMEDGEEKTKTSLWEKIKQLCHKIALWIKTAISKVAATFRNAKKYLDKNKENIAKNLAAGQKTVKCYDFEEAPENGVKNAINCVSKVIGDIKKEMTLAENAGGGFGEIIKKAFTSVKLGLIQNNFEAMVDAGNHGDKLKAPEKVEKTPKELNITMASFEYFAGKFDSDLTTIKKAWNDIDAEVKKVSKSPSASDKVKTVSTGIKTCNRVVTSIFSTCSKVGSAVNAVMFQLGGKPKEDKQD